MPPRAPPFFSFSELASPGHYNFLHFAFESFPAKKGATIMRSFIHSLPPLWGSHPREKFLGRPLPRQRRLTRSNSLAFTRPGKSLAAFLLNRKASAGHGSGRRYSRPNAVEFYRMSCAVFERSFHMRGMCLVRLRWCHSDECESQSLLLEWLCVNQIFEQRRLYIYARPDKAKIE